MNIPVTSTDLVLTFIVHKTGKTREQALDMLREVGRREPILSMWLDEVYDTAERCADAVVNAASEKPCK